MKNSINYTQQAALGKINNLSALFTLVFCTIAGGTRH
jgi:hypothetical protein